MNDFNIIKDPLMGTNLIEASAGTGKTYTLSSLFLRLILDKGFLIDDILAVTYTEAATKELRLRIRRKIRNAFDSLTHIDIGTSGDELLNEFVGKYRNDEGAISRLRHALINFDEASVFTIHGFCHRMLLQNAFESRSLFDTELLTDRDYLIQGIVDDFWRINFYTASRLFIQYAKIKKFTPENITSLFSKRSVDPGFKIVPYTERPNVSELEKLLIEYFHKLKDSWSLAKCDLENILLNDKGLDRRKYKSYSISAWISEMEGYFNLDLPDLNFDKLEKFSSSIIKNSMKSGFEGKAPQHTFFDICDEYLKTYLSLQEKYDQYILSLKREAFEFLEIELAKAKDRWNIRLFDDLLGDMHKALLMHKDTELSNAVASRYKAVLIDEFQDTDPLQYDIFKTIFGDDKSILYLIGDPKQAIYQFRGADIFAYIKASQNISNRSTLRSNWRSYPDLIKAVNAIFSSVPNPFIYKDIAFHQIDSAKSTSKEMLYLNGEHAQPLNIWFLHYEDKDGKVGTIGKGRAETLISSAVASEISRLIISDGEGSAVIGERSVKAGDIAVLVRKNKQARIVKEHLNSLNIPSVIYGADSIFISHEAREMQRVISAIVEQRNETLIRAALSTDIFGYSGNDLYKMIDDEIIWEDRLNTFLQYHDLWVQHGFMSMFSVLMKNENVRIKMLSFPDGERRMTNLLHCIEILHRAEVDLKLGLEGLLKWFIEKCSIEDRSDENQIRLETDEDAVRIVTIHKSKGLEYPIVFCPFAWEGSTVDKDDPFLFHDIHNNNNLTLDISNSNEENIRIAETENLAENIRLLYVALTRAKNLCYIAWGKINKAETSAPAYIFHCPNNVDPNNIVTELSAHVKALDSNIMFENLKELEKNSEGAIRVSYLPQLKGKHFFPDHESDSEFQCSKFTGRISSDWVISSYSSLISTQSALSEQPDYDRVKNSALIQDGSSEEETIFGFPHGLKAGSCIHEIFENVDFCFDNIADIEILIEEKLAKYGFDLIWKDVICKMVNSVLSAPLAEDRSDFILRNIGKRDRLNELEFYFPIDRISSSGFSDILAQAGLQGSGRNLVRQIGKLEFHQSKGFMKGYIDMVFNYKNRFYIVDWKTNYLGGNIRDYSREKLDLVMYEHCYSLQYYLYIIALHRYLNNRMPGYNYEMNFGGVYYIFVRGVDPEFSPLFGIYSDYPSFETIASLNSYLSSDS
ncbi:MAG: exodeoxyribonuclease V subunit beta [Spirochaetota bacterium]|nr:exodeoxyribonuclease V subunit beta [Spirochaetota bacterium]